MLKKKYFFINSSIITAIILVVSVIFFKEDPVNTIVLKGASEITLYKGETYFENGYYAFNNNDEDISKKVKVISNLNTDVPGIYNIHYYIGDSSVSRKINIIDGIRYAIPLSPNELSSNQEKEEDIEEVPFIETYPPEPSGDFSDPPLDSFEPKIEKIDYKYTYNERKGLMPYALFTPSSIKEGRKTPLIIFLHGSGGVGSSAEDFGNGGTVGTLHKYWLMNGSNAYILCPHLAGNGYSRVWCNTTSLNNLNKLLDTLIPELNIDKNRISIMGHSLGGQGALYMAVKAKDRYTCCVPLSGYPAGVDLSPLKNFPVRGFVGTDDAKGSKNFMHGEYLRVLGEEHLEVVYGGHGDVPWAAITADEDNDNRSDLFEWMINQDKNSFVYFN